MKYKIQALEQKTTKTGKPYFASTLEAEDGTAVKVSLWSNFPGFESYAIGTVLDGSIAQDGKYHNFTPSELGEAQIRTTGGYRRPNAGIQVAMERKNESIKEFQGAKERSIKIASAMRDATLVITSLYDDFFKEIKEKRDEEIKAEHKKWVNFFLDQWGAVEDGVNIPF